MKTLQKVISQSTCLKRIVVCELYDRAGNLLARESNRCNPPGNKCSRIGVAQGKGNYDATSSCNWTHAEVMAVQALQENDKPFRAILYGHTFMCIQCEELLKSIGCIEFIIEPKILDR